MKYNAKQLSDGRWAVFTGKRYWPKTATEDRDEAKQTAAEFSADWHIGQIKKLLPTMNLVAARSIGHVADSIIDSVIDRNRTEDPENFDEMDPRGWLA